MRNWKKNLLLPTLGVAVIFAAFAPTAASAETDAATARPADRVTDVRPDQRPDRRPDQRPDVRPTDHRPNVTDVDGRVELREGHTLEARGIGNVTIVGRGKLHGVAYDGTLTIKDVGGDANIDVSARARRVHDDGSITFYGLTGEFEISGSALKIEFNRTRTHFQASGVGRFDLQGVGWYQVDDGRHLPWRAH